MRVVRLAELLMVVLLSALALPAIGQSLAQARSQETAKDFVGALQTYKTWLSAADGTGEDKRYVRIRLPVLEEAIRLGAGDDLTLYLDALAERASQNVPAAFARLNQIFVDYPQSRLRDDSRYLSGYILLMDQFDFKRASEAMSELQAEFPDSSYFDSALYAQAIAEEQLGNTATATELFASLRHRHTGFTIGIFDFMLPKDSVFSRFWFSRSNNRLTTIKLAKHHVARVVDRKPISHDQFRWRLLVSSAGREYILLVKPSAILQDSQISHAMPDTAGEDVVETLSGIVEGEPESWVRVTLQGNTLAGTISVGGDRQPLIAAATGGTLGYYNRLLRSDINGIASSQYADALQPPAPDNAIDRYLRRIRSRSANVDKRPGVTHVARLGVVIDSQFNDYHGGRGFQKALTILNTSDGIFREELGIALHIESVVVITNRSNDPMNIGRKPMEQMIRNFRRYRLSSTALSSKIGIATLFSGNKNSDLPLGLAWIGTACRSDGYDVSVVTPFEKPGLLSAHEIAHNMGAQHDSDTQCGENRHLMSRNLSRDTEQTFSSCSRSSVAEYISRVGCLVKTSPLG